MQSNFLKDHADTIALIGVNIAIAINFYITVNNMDAIQNINKRLDAIDMMFYDLSKEIKNER